MMNARFVLLIVLAAMSVLFAVRWIRAPRPRVAKGLTGSRGHGLAHVAVGFVTNFFDTLGIGSFATTTTAFKVLRLVPDERIPGTMIVGHAWPATAQALIFIAVVRVDSTLLLSMVAASVAGVWLDRNDETLRWRRGGRSAGTIASSRGSASVTPAPRRNVRRGMCFFAMNMMQSLKSP